MSTKALLLSMLTLVLAFSGPRSFADEVHVTFRGIVDLLDDRGVTPDPRSFIVIPNLADPAKLPLVEKCKPKSKHDAYVLYDPNRVNLDVTGAGACFRGKQSVRSCGEGKTYKGYSLAGCAARFAGEGAGVETNRWPAVDVPTRPTDEANLNWLLDIDALTANAQLKLRSGLAGGSPLYQNYPILASRIVLDRGKLTAGYVYRSGAGPVRFRLPAPHPERAGSTGLEWSVGNLEAKLSLCPLSEPNCAEPVELLFSPTKGNTGVHLLVVSEEFGTKDECDQFAHSSHFPAHYALRNGSETFEGCEAGPYLPHEQVGRLNLNPQCSPGDNQSP